jgi:hypothetical protein
MNFIKIIDGHYNEKFSVSDGGIITIDGKPYRCRYLNDMKFELTGRNSRAATFTISASLAGI